MSIPPSSTSAVAAVPSSTPTLVAQSSTSSVDSSFAANAASLHLAYLHAWPLIGKLGTGDPFPIKKLDFDSERALLFNTLNQANKAIRLQMEVATSDNLLRLITMGCRAIHYTGHGMPTCLAFEDDEGKMHPMDPGQLRELVEAGRQSAPSSSSSPGNNTSSSPSSSGIEFVFVSACHSESAGLAFVAAGVPHVIAVKTEAAVCDKASQVFMNHFYLALLVGKTVRASFDIGQKAVRHNPRLNGGDEPRKFLLLPEQADHEKTLFTDIPSGRWTDASLPPVPHTIPAIPENFLGRNFLIQKVISSLAKKRLITLTGSRGIGKTSVAVAAARYIWKRSHFDGVFMVDLRKLSSGNSANTSTDQDDQRTGEDGHTSPHHHSMQSHQKHNLASLVSQACQLDETHRNTARLFRALQSIPRLLLILDGVDSVLHRGSSNGDETSHEGEEGASNSGNTNSSSSTTPHDIRGFISDLLRSVPGSKVLVTSCFALAGIQDVVESQLEVRPLAPIDAAQLFYDLRPRDIELAEFGCDDPKKAASKLSEHPALKLLAGHPRRIFNAVPHLREMKMSELTAVIEANIRREQQLENSNSPSTHWNASVHHSHHPNNVTTPRASGGSRTHTPEPYVPSSASAIVSPASASVDLFEHNLHIWFGGHTPPAGLASTISQHDWYEATQSGVAFWRSSFGRTEIIPWNESFERTVNAYFMNAIGSTERPLESLDLRTFQTKLESLGSPLGYVHVQIFGGFWRDWLTFCLTIRKILPYWLCSSPTRVIHGWCNRAVCTSLLIDNVQQGGGQAVNRPIGTFALRMSESQVGSIAVGFVDQTNKILHTLISTKGDHFVLNLTDGGRSYTSLSDLLLQCRPFVSLYPGIDKVAVLGNGGVLVQNQHPPAGVAAPAEGEGVPSGAMVSYPPIHHPHAHTPSSGQFQSFPNNAQGGSVGLMTPPPSGHNPSQQFAFNGGGAPPTHPGLHHVNSSGAASGGHNPLERLPLVHAQSAFSPIHHPSASPQNPGRLPHPNSFPSLQNLSNALPQQQEGAAPTPNPPPQYEGHAPGLR